MWLTALTLNLAATGVGMPVFPRLGLSSSFLHEQYHWGRLSAAKLRDYKNAERLASTGPMARTSARKDVFWGPFLKINLDIYRERENHLYNDV